MNMNIIIIQPNQTTVVGQDKTGQDRTEAIAVKCPQLRTFKGQTKEQ